MNITPEVDAVLAAMRRAGVQETRENYLKWACATEPAETDWEFESMLPEQFSRYALDETEGIQ